MMDARTILVEEAVYPDRFRLLAELPGIDPVHDLRVTCDGSELRLDATRDPPTTAARGQSELWYGRRVRVVAVPWDVRCGTMTARYADGLLEVTADRGAPEPRRSAFQVPIFTAVRPERRAKS
ncbi:Hsp20/alpha crystallin family protein [Asanoa sp. NPDC049518]|uniref:Hsp20/alpha crystallin family protein n=1 Tax=unclassified Asanoa TaxID=2685164 RepID=UPI0034442DBA